MDPHHHSRMSLFSPEARRQRLLSGDSGANVFIEPELRTLLESAQQAVGEQTTVPADQYLHLMELFIGHMATGGNQVIAMPSEHLLRLFELTDEVEVMTVHETVPQPPLALLPGNSSDVFSSAA